MESNMTKEKINFFKEALLRERLELIEELAISNENFANLDKQLKAGDLVDQAYNFYEKELLIGLSTSEKQNLLAIDKALEKIDKNKFGYCESCNQSIDEKRLEAIPYATLCVNCKKDTKSRHKPKHTDD